MSAPRIVSFVVSGDPVAKGRHRSALVRGKTIHYTPAKTKAYEQLVATCAAAKMAGRPLMTGPISMDLNVFMAIPPSWPKWKRQAAISGAMHHTSTPDAENVLKTVQDALNGVVYRDDSQIDHVRLTKSYSATPGVYVEIKELSNATSKGEWEKWCEEFVRGGRL